jgi:hypothetical protein
MAVLMECSWGKNISAHNPSRLLLTRLTIDACTKDWDEGEIGHVFTSALLISITARDNQREPCMNQLTR